MEQRTFLIVKFLLDSEEVKTLSEIAEHLNVSSKTISRQISKVETLLNDYGLTLEKRTGSGLLIMGSAVKKFALLESLKKPLAKKEYSPKERLSVIISQLLQSREPIKLFVLSSMLNVTDSTISNDLDKLEPWFHEQRLKLLRKPGLGISLIGEERDFRRAMVKYIYEHIGENELLHLVQENLNPNSDKKIAQVSNFLLDLIDENIWRKIDMIIHELKIDFDYQLSDNAFIGLLVHLSLTVQRIKKHEAVQIEPESIALLKTKREFKIAESLANKIAAIFEIKVPENEIAYITMHLLGARNRYQAENLGSISMMNNFQLVRLARSIMKTAAKETGCSIEKNSNLLAGLVNHLGTSISRMKMQMDIRNPLLPEMQQHYPELMILTKKCIGGVESELNVKLPESEIAYIAMHLGAALADSKPFIHSVHRVVVACPTGMGTSRLLASKLRSQFQNLRIVDQVPILTITPNYVASLDFEFVISTVAISNLTCPVVVVSAALTHEDRLKIEAEIARQNETFLNTVQEIETNKLSFPDALSKINEYSSAILSLLSNYFFERIAADSIVKTCEIAGKIAGDSVESAEGIKKSLLQREDKGSTVITGHNMVLLHCKSKYVKSLSFGILQLGEGFKYPEDGEIVKTAIVMLAPENSTECSIDTIGHAASVLLDRWRFIEILHEGDKIEIYNELIKIFEDFYKMKYRELIGI